MQYRFNGSLALLQLSNGHLKLPSYFGAIAVLVCFVSAGFSLAFAFAIIPRQVMPWTGLLLMLEWTFVAFFLLFGSYLRFVYRWGSISANHVGFSNSDSSENHMGPGMLNYVTSQSFTILVLNNLVFCRPSAKYVWLRHGCNILLDRDGIYSYYYCTVTDYLGHNCIVHKVRHLTAPLCINFCYRYMKNVGKIEL